MPSDAKVSPLTDPLLDTSATDSEDGRTEKQGRGDDKDDADDDWSLSPSQQRWRRLGQLWKSHLAPLLFIVLVLIPVIIHRRNYWSDFLSQNWYAPLMGIVACAVPSGGAPVAGGIIFLPILTMRGDIDTHAAVAFAAATQSFGVGWFAPLGWMGQDPSVIMARNFLVPVAPWGLAGLLTGILLIPLRRSKEVLWAFTAFTIMLAGWVVKGLVTKELDVSIQPRCHKSDGADGDASNNDDVITYVAKAVRASFSGQSSNRKIAETPEDEIRPPWLEDEEESRGSRAQRSGGVGDDREEWEGNDANARQSDPPNETMSPPTAAAVSIQEENRCKMQKRCIKFTKKTYALYAIVAFAGGILTGWIGIGIEKMMFLLLTSVHKVDVVAAGLSSVVLTGWLSIAAFALHALCSPPTDDDDAPGPHWKCAVKWEGFNPDGHVLGNVPYDLLLAVLPGVLLGSFIGPKINAAVGPRNVMILFVFFLLFDAIYNIVHLTAL